MGKLLFVGKNNIDVLLPPKVCIPVCIYLETCVLSAEFL